MRRNDYPFLTQRMPSFFPGHIAPSRFRAPRHTKRYSAFFLPVVRAHHVTLARASAIRLLILRGFNQKQHVLTVSTNASQVTCRLKRIVSCFPQPGFEQRATLHNRIQLALAWYKTSARIQWRTRFNRPISGNFFGKWLNVLPRTCVPILWRQRVPLTRICSESC